MIPTFEVEGVPLDDSWQLYNCSNYKYFAQKVRQLRKPFPESCSFCVIDPKVNVVLHQNRSWRIWPNTMAPASGQEVQLIIPSIRHIERMSEISVTEWDDLRDMFHWAKTKLGYGDDGFWNIRSGDFRTNAKSMPHMHWNFLKSADTQKVEITVGKGPQDYAKKLPTLVIWHKYFVAEEAGHPNPREALTEAEWQSVEKTFSAPKSAKTVEKPTLAPA